MIEEEEEGGSTAEKEAVGGGGEGDLDEMGVLELAVSGEVVNDGD